MQQPELIRRSNFVGEGQIRRAVNMIRLTEQRRRSLCVLRRILGRITSLFRCHGEKLTARRGRGCATRISNAAEAEYVRRGDVVGTGALKSPSPFYICNDVAKSESSGKVVRLFD